jgi:hypothetical protein
VVEVGNFGRGKFAEEDTVVGEQGIPIDLLSGSYIVAVASEKPAAAQPASYYAPLAALAANFA